MEQKNGLLSKINWVQIVSLIATGLTLFGFDLTPEQQAGIVSTIVAGSNLLTIVLRTYFTSAKITGFLTR